MMRLVALLLWPLCWWSHVRRTLKAMRTAQALERSMTATLGRKPWSRSRWAAMKLGAMWYGVSSGWGHSCNLALIVVAELAHPGCMIQSIMKANPPKPEPPRKGRKVAPFRAPTKKGR